MLRSAAKLHYPDHAVLTNIHHQCATTGFLEVAACTLKSHKAQAGMGAKTCRPFLHRMLVAALADFTLCFGMTMVLWQSEQNH